MKTVKKVIISLLFLFFYVSALPQTATKDTTASIQKAENKRDVYTLNPCVDIPIISVGTVWAIYASHVIYTKPPPNQQQLNSLNKNNINSFDRRFAIYKYSASLDKLAYYPFFAAFPYPFIVFLANRNQKKDLAKLSALYAEVLAVTGIFGFSGPYFVNQYRPYDYDPQNPVSKQMSHTSENSFYSGHAQIVAASTFFAAKVYADYYPDSKYRWVFYGIATLATCAEGYMRYDAGEHFPSDVLLGMGMGAAIGILVPQLHKHKLIKNRDVSFMPYVNTTNGGFVLTYN